MFKGPSSHGRHDSQVLAELRELRLLDAHLKRVWKLSNRTARLELGSCEETRQMQSTRNRLKKFIPIKINKSHKESSEGLLREVIKILKSLIT